MDIVSWLLSRAYVDKTLVGMGALKGAPAMISSIVDNPDGTHDITFSWKDNLDVVHTSVLTVSNGETPTIVSTEITGGHKIEFSTTVPEQSISFNIMDGEQGISVVDADVDSENTLTLTLSDGTEINAGTIWSITTIDDSLSSTSNNPVENKIITNALNNKVDKEMGKGLSTEDFTSAEKNKLSNIQDNAQVNVIEKITINGQEATIVDKNISLNIITSAVNNLQNYYLKTETYTKQEIEDLIGSTVGVTIDIVEQLPSEGQTNIIYFLPTETENIYSQYIYTSNTWVLIGSTTVDLSNYYTKTQIDTLLSNKQDVITIDANPTAMSDNPVASGGVYSAIAQVKSQSQSQFQFINMPTPSEDNLGFVYQYIGESGTYTQDMFYRCVYNSELETYEWQEVIFNAVITIDSEINSTSTNPVQNKVIKEALDEKQDIIQYSILPSAQDNLGRLVQYIGATTAEYRNGYFYKSIYEDGVYRWELQSTSVIIDDELNSNSTNPVQNKVITKEIENIWDANNILGAKNLLPNNATTQIVNGVTFTVNADGSITCSGTSTARSYITVYNGDALVNLIGEKIIINGCPSGGDSVNGYDLSIAFFNNGTQVNKFFDVGEGLEFIVPIHDNARIYVIAEVANIDMSNKIFYPMIRLASNLDDTYVPYAMTNRELMKINDITTVVPTKTSIVNSFNFVKSGHIVSFYMSVRPTRAAFSELFTNAPKLATGEMHIQGISSGGAILKSWCGIYNSGLVRVYANDAEVNTTMLFSGTYITRD